MRTPYKAPPAFDAEKIAKDLFQNQQKRALKVRELRIKKGYAYQFVAGAVEDMWFNGEAGWPIQHKIYRAIGEAICREAARCLNEPYKYPWDDK